MHGRPALFSPFDAFPTFFPHCRVEETLSIGYGLLILPFPRHLGVLVEALGVGRGTGALARLPALLGAVGDHVLLLGLAQSQQAQQ